MNRVAIFGGLGNQMFQYALAISMDAEGIPTKISVNDFLLNRHYQGFELVKAFNVPLPIFDRVKASIMTKVRPLFVDTNPGLVKNTLSKWLLKGNNISPEFFIFDRYLAEPEVF